MHCAFMVSLCWHLGGKQWHEVLFADTHSSTAASIRRAVAAREDWSLRGRADVITVAWLL